ncbi:uncharacterized protein LOC133030514 [Cannabis sativa]|uniref:uncharacterized protein LOC133030514 n=1 Tax=Cannabis sativa TaxID=3483 RepID=UPI0029CA33C4|nr:uncharacterized protein LOC133030514 [Cannabis sativa]
MSTISWNCRGLGNPRAQQFLEDICVQKKPKFLFLSETLCKKEIVERVKVRLGFECSFAVDVVGRKGVLAFFWKNSSEAHLLGYSQNHIDVEVKISGREPWRLSGIYGEPNRAHRDRTWTFIRALHAESTLPWCLIGDLITLPVTLIKKGVGLIHLLLFLVFKLQSMTAISWIWTCKGTHHSPIFLEPESLNSHATAYHFRYENAWSREPLCAQIVGNYWEQHGQQNIVDKIKGCSHHLAAWGRTLTGNFKVRLSQSKQKMVVLKNSEDEFDAETFVEEKNNYFEILAQQELYWKQRSKQHWLHSGDKNNKYFHAVASARKRSNKIQYLQDENGSWRTWGTGIDNLILDYFSALYTTNSSSWSHVIGNVRNSITASHNEELLQPIGDDEVKNALFQMHPDKAPGPDGMGPGFFQHHWSIVGADIINLVKEFFSTSVLPCSINDTNLCLIPKKKNFSTMNELRPIALCNVIYKIISKVLANRMRGFIDQIISDTQSAFIPGRLISDNVMVAFEIMHYLKRRRTNKKGFMALKLDMSKAYDRVEWGFLSAIMSRMGFSEKWVDLIMTCVSSVQYKIVHGGHSLGPITPSRGIRQGDPLSTYLFIICAEGLSSLIQQFETRRVIQGCRVAQRAPAITHMFFADDSYLFCQATSGAADGVRSLLQMFEVASGQKVNCSKSSIFFSPNTELSTRTQICSIFNMAEATEGSLYLGLPNIIGRNKKIILGFIKNKVISRINSWEGKFLSRAGKEILIKTVLQSLPTYAMSVFLLPIGTCDEIESLMANFWWKTKSSKGRGITWMTWDQLASSKEDGGMGFRHLHDFNLDMLAKQGWRLLCNPNSLVGRVFKAKYFPNSDFLSADIGNNPSFVWRSVWGAQDLVRSGASRVIGDGANTKIIGHPWLPQPSNRFVSSTHPSLQNNTVDSLFQVGIRRWDSEVIHDLFFPNETDLILGMPLYDTDTSDCWSWAENRNGFFTVRSAYLLLQQQRARSHDSNNSGFWRKLWHLKIPPKVINFLWRAITGCLPTCLNLVGKHVPISVKCPVCSASFGAWVDALLHISDADMICRATVLCWAVWKARNQTVWDKRIATVNDVIISASTTFDHWKKAQDKTTLLSLLIENNKEGAEYWIKPEENHIKINVDAALFHQEGSYGYALVARDSSANLIEAKTCFQGGYYTAEIVEALGIKEALSWIKRENWTNVQIESDSLLSVQAIRSNQHFSSNFGLLIQDCQLLLSSLQSVNLCFVRRSANGVAHAIASHSRFLSGCSIFEHKAWADLKVLLYSEC